MDLTPQELWTVRNIIVRAVNETHEVLAGAARRSQDRARANTTSARDVSPASRADVAELSGKLTLTLKEASGALGLSRSTLYKLIAEGRLQTVRIGGRRLIELRAIKSILASARGGMWSEKPRSSAGSSMRPAHSRENP